MFKNILSYGLNLIGGSSVQTYIYIALLFGGFGAGFYVEHLRFSNYQIQIEQAAKAQEAHNEAVKKQHEIVTYYSNGVRQPSSSTASPISTTASIANASAAYNQLAYQCSQTTLMLVELQKWLTEQVGIANDQ